MAETNGSTRALTLSAATPALIIHVNGSARAIDPNVIVEDNHRRRKFDDRQILVSRNGPFDCYHGRAEAFIAAGFFEDATLFPGQPGRKKTSETLPLPQDNSPVYVRKIGRNGNTFQVRVEFSIEEQARREAERKHREAEAAMRAAEVKKAEIQAVLNMPRIKMSHLTESEQALITSFRLMSPRNQHITLAYMQASREECVEEHRQNAAAARIKVRENLKLVASHTFAVSNGIVRTPSLKLVAQKGGV